MFEGLKARLEKLLADHTVSADPRQRSAMLHAALVDAKVAVSTMRDALSATERAITAETEQLQAAERRGRLASQISDAETMRVAEQFVTRHRERLEMLRRKVEAQREELSLTERDVGQMTEELRQLRQGTGPGPTAAQGAAWRDLEAAGGVRPETDTDDELLKSRLNRSRLDAAVQEQLDHLKKKLGKDGA